MQTFYHNLLKQYTMQYKELTNSLEQTRRKNGKAFLDQPLEQPLQSHFFFFFFIKRKMQREKRYNRNQPQSKGWRSSRECERGRSNQVRPRNNDRTTPQCSICKKNNYDSNQCWSKQCTKSRNSDHKVKLSNEGEEWSLILENMEGTL